MERLEFTAAPGDTGRLDAWLAGQCPTLSRSALQGLMEQGLVTRNGAPVNKKEKVLPGAVYTIDLLDPQPIEAVPQNIPLDIVYEDEDLMVINKPAGMPIHPSMGNYDNTVANALAWYFQEQGLPFVFRCINRLDRDTSGLTLIAKHYVSAGILSAMVAAKSAENPRNSTPPIRREYLALVRGSVQPPQGTVNAPLSRKPGSVIERVVDFEHGEHAVTHYKVIDEKNGHSLLSLELETGRTHQIRIHMKYLGFPLIGDYLYNPDMEFMTRQALHSHRLCFTHPITGERMEFTAPLPDDMRRVLEPQSDLI